MISLRHGVTNERKTLWVRCPICYRKTRTKVNQETVLINFPLFCPKCRKEVLINVVQLKMTYSIEPAE